MRYAAALLCLVPGFIALVSTVAQAQDSNEKLLQLDVGTNVPFVAYQADVTVSIGSNGDLESVSVSGNVPGMQTTYATYQDFVSHGGYHMSGSRGDAFGMNLQGSFSQSSGGDLSVYALMCSGGRQTTTIHVERQGSSQQWEVEENNRRIMTIHLEAHVGLGGWEGCFDSMSGS
jgi:hypothetical protein